MVILVLVTGFLGPVTSFPKCVLWFPNIAFLLNFSLKKEA